MSVKPNKKINISTVKIKPVIKADRLLTYTYTPDSILINITPDTTVTAEMIIKHRKPHCRVCTKDNTFTLEPTKMAYVARMGKWVIEGIDSNRRKSVLIKVFALIDGTNFKPKTK